MAPPGEEIRPQPWDNEVVVCADHVTRGFRPPGSWFFRSLLGYYGLHPQDLATNSFLSISKLTVFCEVYLLRKPTIECGAVTIQHWDKCNYPSKKLNSNTKDC